MGIATENRFHYELCKAFGLDVDPPREQTTVTINEIHVDAEKTIDFEKYGIEVIR